MITQFLEYLAGQPKMSKSEEEIARKAWETCRREIANKIDYEIKRMSELANKRDHDDEYWMGYDNAIDEINNILEDL